MFISQKQLGQVAASLCVGAMSGFATKKLTSKLYQSYYNWHYEPKKDDKEKQQAAFKTADKVLNFVSTFVGVAAGAYCANRMGLISLPSLAQVYSFLEEKVSASQGPVNADTAKKVTDVAAKTDIIDNLYNFDNYDNLDI